MGNQSQSCQLSIRMPPELIAPATRIGSRNHWAAVDQNKENVQSFGFYTQDHQHLIAHIAIRDITGKSGLAIIEAILSGNRDPNELASLVDVRMKKFKEEIAQSLQGLWRPELLFELKAAPGFLQTLPGISLDL